MRWFGRLRRGSRRAAVARAKKRIAKMEKRAFVEHYHQTFMGGLYGLAFSVELNGWKLASRDWNDDLKRKVKQYMRFAKWLHDRGLWSSAR